MTNRTPTLYDIPGRVLPVMENCQVNVRYVHGTKGTSMILDWMPQARSAMSRLVYLTFRSPTGEGERLLVRSKYLHSFTMSRNRELSLNMRFSHQEVARIEYDLTEDFEKLIGHLVAFLKDSVEPQI